MDLFGTIMGPYLDPIWDLFYPVLALFCPVWPILGPIIDHFRPIIDHFWTLENHFSGFIAFLKSSNSMVFRNSMVFSGFATIRHGQYWTLRQRA